MALAPQLGRVDLDTRTFDFKQHTGHFHFELIDKLESRIVFDLWAQHIMQTHGEIRIFAGILCCALKIHLIKADLMRTLAAQFLKGDALHAQIALSQLIQAYATVRLQHIRLQHRVVRNTLEINPFIRKDVGVVLRVMQ